MPAAVDLNAIARQIQEAQDAARQIAPFTSQHSDFDIAAGYAVADLIHQARVQAGAVSVGRKIGYTNPDLWPRFGISDPVWAHVYKHTVVHVRGKQQTCSIGKLLAPKIEPEIVFHFHAAPPPNGSLAQILACVDWVAPGFEIVHAHYPDWKLQVADALADGTLHAMLLVGEPQAVDQLGTDVIAALQRFSLALSCNGALRESGTGAAVLGSPLAAIAHLMAVLAKQPQSMPLQANELVTTGTITNAQLLHAGESWCMEIQGIALPNLCVAFTQ